MCKTTNSLYRTDNQGLPIAISSPVSGNHHDLYEIEEPLDELFMTLKNTTINTDGLFVNADAGFDSKKFRDKCSQYGVIANTALNPRNVSENKNVLFDDELYEQRYTIERANAWMDSYRTLLNRVETIVDNCKSFNYIALSLYSLRILTKIESLDDFLDYLFTVKNLMLFSTIIHYIFTDFLTLPIRRTTSQMLHSNRQ